MTAEGFSHYVVRKPFCRQATRGKGVRPPSMSTANPDYAVTAHGRARFEVTEMKAPVTFTPVLIYFSKNTMF